MEQQFQAGSPVIGAQSVVSEASGYEALSKAFVSLGVEAGKVAVTQGQAESQALLFMDTRELHEKKREASYAIGTASSPDDVADAVASYTKSIGAMEDNASLNDKDRGTFVNRSQSSIDSIADQGMKAELKMAKGISKHTLMGDYKTNLAQYSDEIFSNPEAAQELFDRQKQIYDNAHDVGLLTTDEWHNAIDGYLYIQQGATDFFNKINNGNVSAEDANNATMLGSGGAHTKDAALATVNLHDDFTKRTTYKVAVEDLIRNGDVVGTSYLGFSAHDRDQYQLAVEGYKNATSMIQSNMPVQLIDERMAKLANIPAGAMTESERVELDTLKLAKNEIKNDFSGHLLKTAAGAQIAEQAKDESVGINNALMSESQKAAYNKQNYNQTIDKMVDLGRAQGFNPRDIKPAPVADLQALDRGFSMGGDPQEALDTIGEWSKPNIPWLANSINDPQQAQIVSAIGYNMDNPDAPSSIFNKRMIEANQKGITFHGLNQSTKEGNDDKSINAAIVTKLQPVLGYMSTEKDGIQGGSAMIKSVNNYVKYAALANQDPDIKNVKEYINEGVKIYNDAYPVQQGSNYVFNTNEINLTKGDIQAVVSYVGDQLKDSNQYSNTPFTVTYQLGNIVALSREGETLASYRYDRHFVSAASHEWNAKQAEIAKKVKNAERQATPLTQVFGTASQSLAIRDKINETASNIVSKAGQSPEGSADAREALNNALKSVDKGIQSVKDKVKGK